ncbi:hypothetical protein HanRHA438_Chr02g0096671 [Helianthus annuus]|nr:hypothetical protein HanRHA438_Chr02g0096671 [Helianthus annuus]
MNTMTLMMTCKHQETKKFINKNSNFIKQELYLMFLINNGELKYEKPMLETSKNQQTHKTKKNKKKILLFFLDIDIDIKLTLLVKNHC